MTWQLFFDEALAALQRRLGNRIPTAGWRDLMREGHDKGFAVAGAMQADLLADLAEAVEAAITDGMSIESFRVSFDLAVERYGWGYKGERNWRTRVIYGTNLRTSYAAGRLAQLRDPGLQAVAPLWLYRHGGSLDPRPEHQAWDGLAIRGDHSWWQTHYPPNGWGCSCYVVAVDEETARSLGATITDSPPADQPGAIDEGWDYMPGATVEEDLRRAAKDE